MPDGPLPCLDFFFTLLFTVMTGKLPIDVGQGPESRESQGGAGVAGCVCWCVPEGGSISTPVFIAIGGQCHPGLTNKNWIVWILDWAGMIAGSALLDQSVKGRS